MILDIVKFGVGTVADLSSSKVITDVLKNNLDLVGIGKGKAIIYGIGISCIAGLVGSAVNNHVTTTIDKTAATMKHVLNKVNIPDEEVEDGE